MNLFDRLLYRRLCNEQPADGGAAPAPSEPAAPVADAPAPAVDRAKPEAISNSPVLKVTNLSTTNQLMVKSQRISLLKKKSRSRKARRRNTNSKQVKASSWTLKH